MDPVGSSVLTRNNLFHSDLLQNKNLCRSRVLYRGSDRGKTEVARGSDLGVAGGIYCDFGDAEVVFGIWYVSDHRQIPRKEFYR